MQEIRLDKFNELIEHVQQIKEKMIEEKKKEKWTFEWIMKYVTLTIAVISIGLSIYTLFRNNFNFRKTSEFQRETQAYNFWLSYLRVAAQEPLLANGPSTIDNIPVEVLACRNGEAIKIEDSTEEQFVKYAWFAAYALGTAEIVSDLVKKDTIWISVIDAIISNHKDYITSSCFDRGHYGDFMNERFGVIAPLKNDTLLHSK